MDTDDTMTSSDDDLGQLCIQVQPDRAPDLDLDALKLIADALARSTPGVRGIGFTEGDEAGRFLNIVLAASDPVSAWRALRPGLFGHAAVGPSLEGACLAVCTGADGWNDPRLLHHFDPAVAPDPEGDA